MKTFLWQTSTCELYVKVQFSLQISFGNLPLQKPLRTTLGPSKHVSKFVMGQREASFIIKKYL